MRKKKKDEEPEGCSGIVYAIYGRVSGDAQRERQTIEVQMDACGALVNQHPDWKPYRAEPYKDDGISGEDIDTRPAFTEILEDLVENRKINTLVLSHIDRLSRSTTDQQHAYITDMLRKKGVKLAIVGNGGELTDLNNPDQDLMVGQLQGWSKYEKRRILKRTWDGRVKKAAEGGRANCKDPYGWRWVRGARSGTGAYELVPDQVAAIRVMIELALAGNGAWRIVQELERLEIPFPGPPRKAGRSRTGWHPASISKILTSIRLKGDWVMLKGTKDIPRKVPAIIDGDTWDRLQHSLTCRRNKPRDAVSGEGLLRGLLKCAVCGYAMTLARVSGGKYLFYRCSSRSNYRHLGMAKHCGNPHQHTKVVDALAWAWATEFATSPSRILEACAVTASQTVEGVDWKVQQQQAEQILEKLNVQQSTFLNLYKKGHLTAGGLDEHLSLLTRERRLAERTVATCKAALASTTDQLTQLKEIEEFATGACVTIEGIDFEGMKALLTKLIVPPRGAFLLHANGDLTVKGRPAFGGPVEMDTEIPAVKTA